MSRYRDQVAAAIAAVTIRGPTSYAWLGRPSRPLPPSLDAELDASERRDYLLACLRGELYCSFYRHGGPVVARWGEPEPVAPDPWLVHELSDANTGTGGTERGWTVDRRVGDDVVVTGARLRVRVRVADCVPGAAGLHPGASVGLRIPKELPSLAPGFWTAVSDAALDPADWERTVRIYWNVGRAGAPRLVAALTARLNDARVPFRLKVADHPFRLERCDAAVLYLPGDAFAGQRESLRIIASRAAPGLRPEIPAFTLQIAPGVGAAEEHGAAQSFGERRCALLADAIVQVHEAGVTGAGARLAHVAAILAAAGVGLDAPYREPALEGRHVL